MDEFLDQFRLEARVNIAAWKVIAFVAAALVIPAAIVLLYHPGA